MLRILQIKEIGFRILRDKAGEGGGGGAGEGEGQGEGEAGSKGGEGEGKTVTLTNEQFEKLLAKANGEGEKDQDDGDLFDKSRKQQADKDKHKGDAKALESAIAFNYRAKDWLKENESLLPKDVNGIFDSAEKETYDSPIQKDRAIKSGIVQAFFNVQENLDLLTATQKNSIEEFLKLTKNGKEEKAQHVYDSVFEPTFEMIKRLKKAEQVRKGGERDSSDAEAAYKDRLIEGSTKHYMGVKKQ